MPIEPASTDASSVRMSPNVFSATTTSKWAGLLMSCIEAASTRTCSSSTSGYSAPSSVAISRQSLPVSRTLALSTEVRRLRRPCASSNPTRSMRSISRSAYLRVSTPRRPREVSQRRLGLPKYKPPVSSRTIIISTPCSRWGLMGLEFMSWG